MSKGRPDTQLAHGGRDPARQGWMVNPPPSRGSTFLFPDLAALEAAGADPARDVYGRVSTPTGRALEGAVADLAGAAGAVAIASGQGAAAMVLLAFCKDGDHLLLPDSLYGATRAFCDHHMARLGVSAEYYPPGIGPGIATLLRDSTRILWLESPGSLTFEMQDVPAMLAAIKDRGVLSVIDNSWATPLYYRPLAQGVDIELVAGTKYIGGHADAMLGLALARSEEHLEPLRLAVNLVGACPGSEEVWLGLRGLRTLSVRLERHHKTGLALAQWLQARPEVRRVLHPALPGHPGHAIWRRDFTGASGLFGLVLDACSHAQLTALMNGLRLFGMGYSWGGFESLLIPVTHLKRSVTPAPEGTLMRLHAGLEDPADLIADLEAGLARMAAA